MMVLLTKIHNRLGVCVCMYVLVQEGEVKNKDLWVGYNKWDFFAYARWDVKEAIKYTILYASREGRDGEKSLVSHYYRDDVQC